MFGLYCRESARRTGWRKVLASTRLLLVKSSRRWVRCPRSARPRSSSGTSCAPRLRRNRNRLRLRRRRGPRTKGRPTRATTGPSRNISPALSVCVTKYLDSSDSSSFRSAPPWVERRLARVEVSRLRPTRRRATGRSLKLPWPARRCAIGASDQFHVLMWGHPFSRRRREVRATTLLCPSPTDGSRRS